jgi:omega-6 fatty acid desaturase (delta-12 desaturase)
MREGKELILATKPFAKEIRSLSWYTTIQCLLLLIAAIAGTFLAPNVVGKLLCSIATAALLSRFFIIFHDYQHHTILQNSKLANIIFTVFGVYMITPPSIWKRSHDHHHHNNAKLFSASIGSYPIMTREKFLASSPKERFGYLAVRHWSIMLFAYLTMFLYGMCIQSFMSSPKRHWDSLVVLIIHVGIAVTIGVVFGPLAWFLSFCLPFVLSHALGAYLFYAQHNFPSAVYRSNQEWNYAKAALESSSYMVMNPVMQWITANIGFHHIHHLNSHIPFYRLPEAMEAIPELQSQRTTRLTLREVRACLRLKVWDPERNRMIGFAELNHRMPRASRRARRAAQEMA